jgi:hypothetical protein
VSNGVSDLSNPQRSSNFNPISSGIKAAVNNDPPPHNFQIKPTEFVNKFDWRYSNNPGL